MTRSARLYVILARNAPRAAVFRRGPSKQVLLLTWDTESDVIEAGQWLKGRMYERRCDLSPDGGLLLYFAASHKPPFHTWTAVSRPPYLTALALWPKGDAWGGGGLFGSQREILLNHWSTQMDLADGFSVPPWLQVRPFGANSGWGENDPLWSTRLSRDGWLRVSGGVRSGTSNAKVMVAYDPPIIWEKQHPHLPRYLLRLSILGIKEEQGAWYLCEHSVVDRANGRTVTFPRSDWADWSHPGDLLLARQGCLYRVRRDREIVADSTEPELVADLRDLTFRPMETPRSFAQWPRKRDG